MRTVPVSFYVLAMLGLLITGFITFGDSYVAVTDFGKSNNEPSFVPSSYDRIDEAKKACSKTLSSASALRVDSNVFRSIVKDLSFINGDWEQEDQGTPLMPFVIPDPSSNYQSPLHLVSFFVNDVDASKQSKKYFSINGVLQLGITPESLHPEKLSRKTLLFQMKPGRSLLLIHFQGIYTESLQNSGERVLCLLGNTMLPSRQPDSPDPWEWIKDYGYSNPPPLLQDDQILLVLHYPKGFSLARRAIRGEMRSLNPKSNPKYFDAIHISSQFGNSAKYEFGSMAIVAKACNPYPYQDFLINSRTSFYKGLDFCAVIERLTSKEDGLTIVPNWRCSGTDAFCSKLGPFVSDKVIRSTDGGFKDFKLLMQNVQCKQTDNSTTASVSSVFRVVHPQGNIYTEAQRSGLGNMTISAEGIWKSSSGQLCMVGCPGIVDKKGNGCDSRICLYIPLSFSIKQRSIIVGRMSTIDNGSSAYFPLSFEKLMQPSELWVEFSTSNPYYIYSKIGSAGALLEKNEPFSFGTLIKKSLLTYPKLETTEPYLVSLSLLSEDLTLHVPGVPDPYPDMQSLITDIQLVITSLGPLFGRYRSAYNASTTDESPYHGSSTEYTEKQLLLNVSAQLMLTSNIYSNFSLVFLEGLYDPHIGKMYLIGCRDARASWNVLRESMDLEEGLDCLIEVVVSYPPTTSRWPANPCARISISSQRNEDDPLYFGLVKIQTFPVLYRKQRLAIVSRRGVEGMLRILTLSVAIACILSQLFYTRDNTDSLPYMSLVMLGVQCLGYGLPLVFDFGDLFRRTGSELDDGLESQWFNMIDYTVKIQVLACFLLTLWLCQKVWKSRRQFLEPHRIPSDRRLLLTTFALHSIGYATVLMFHSQGAMSRLLGKESFVDSLGNSHTIHEWVTVLDEYIGLVHDLFLFPQVIANVLWELDCKPLRMLYFVGITVVRLLPHAYDYFRAPVLNPYFSEEYEFVNPLFDFYSEFVDVAILVAMSLLAFAVYVQQRWSYGKLRRVLGFGPWRLFSLGLKSYERLPSKSFEAELASRVEPMDLKEGEEE